MKKYLAPIIISVLVIIYLVLYFGLIITTIENVFVKIIVGVLPVAFVGTMIFVLIERIKEIRSGEEDDLSKY